MLRLQRKQRDALSQVIRELANLSAGALVLTQLVGQQSRSWRLIAFGIAAWIVLISLALLLVREHR
jgi:hypothetical protein